MPLSNSIGVIDSGIDYGHIDLAANVWVNPLETPGNGLVVDRNPNVIPQLSLFAV